MQIDVRMDVCIGVGACMGTCIGMCTRIQRDESLVMRIRMSFLCMRGVVHIPMCRHMRTDVSADKYRHVIQNESAK